MTGMLYNKARLMWKLVISQCYTLGWAQKSGICMPRILIRFETNKFSLAKVFRQIRGLAPPKNKIEFDQFEAYHLE